MSQDSDLDLPEFDSDTRSGSDVPATTTDGDAAQIVQTLADEDEKTATDLSPVFDVPVNVSAVLGKTHIELNSLLKLKAGSVVELERKVGEAIDIFVNDRLVARGEIVVVDDRLGVTMTEIIKDGDSA
ncbi:flagellar motor switch protein FliN [Hyphobacterium sp. CCMP332]|jgi:flagellar motor switch protein FliN/FliY|uniref:flagellar motor switch protein FliN n=1 Tax=Hyphobacterium sp. CCMP332 TaxID=2749086 RepID=UPI001650D129|nr:flagellar motor switch protein FliN [Hyphobacterium sp. CCMP332]QNL18102.1 flagellar motor switch protein FliN [Hyphobacterium sp. CCMP332]